jgi:hypothetical protein
MGVGAQSKPVEIVNNGSFAIPLVTTATKTLSIPVTGLIHLFF